MRERPPVGNPDRGRFARGDAGLSSSSASARDKVPPSTMILISIIVLIVSYIPSRKISRMKPTDALRGKAAV